MEVFLFDEADATMVLDGNGVHELSNQRHDDLGSTTPTSLRLVSMNSARTDMRSE